MDVEVPLQYLCSAADFFLLLEISRRDLCPGENIFHLQVCSCAQYAEANKLSREIEEGRWTVEEAWVHLEEDLKHMQENDHIPG